VLDLVLVSLAVVLAGDPPAVVLRTAFAQYAETHEAASTQRCWSTWNVLYTYLYTAELIAANPMPMVGRPKLAKTLPKALPADAVAALLRPSMPTRCRGDAPTGSNATAPSSSPPCWLDCAPINWCAPTSVTFVPAGQGHQVGMQEFR
jgi:hypothetical protein